MKRARTLTSKITCAPSSIRRSLSTLGIARNSSFTYKGRPVDVKLVGRELGVRYVLEGSVRRAGRHMRIAGQLIDASTGAHLWADRFDGRVEDIFELQDQITASVVGAIAPKVEQAEIERTWRKPTENLDAYDYYLRGIATAEEPGKESSREANEEALRLFYKAIELDPKFASAYGSVALCFARRKTRGWVIDREQETAEAARLAWHAAQLGQDDADSLSLAGYVLARVVGELDVGAALTDRAVLLNRNSALAWHCSGIMKCYLGDPDIAIEHFARSMRLNPLGVYVFHSQTFMGFSHLLAGRYNEAYFWANKALEHRPNFDPAMRLVTISSALSGRLDEAQKTMRHLLQLRPTLRIPDLKDVYPFRRPEDLACVIEGFRKAGMPERSGPEDQ